MGSGRALSSCGPQGLPFVGPLALGCWAVLPAGGSLPPSPHQPDPIRAVLALWPQNQTAIPKLDPQKKR